MQILNTYEHLGLHLAATNGNAGLVKFSLDHGVPIDATIEGFTALHAASISDSNVAIVQYLIDRGADVNATRWSKKHSKTSSSARSIGATALHVACTNGCAKIVDVLLRNGSLIDVRDEYHSTPLSIAQAKQFETIVQRLLKEKDTPRPPERTSSLESVRGRIIRRPPRLQTGWVSSVQEDGSAMTHGLASASYSYSTKFALDDPQYLASLELRALGHDIISSRRRSLSAGYPLPEAIPSWGPSHSQYPKSAIPTMTSRDRPAEEENSYGRQLVTGPQSASVLEGESGLIVPSKNRRGRSNSASTFKWIPLPWSKKPEK